MLRTGCRPGQKGRRLARGVSPGRSSRPCGAWESAAISSRPCTATKDARLNRAAADQTIFDPKASGRIVGRLVAEGFSDELRERRYLIIDGVDGRTHYVELGLRRAEDEPLIRNTIVE